MSKDTNCGNCQAFRDKDGYCRHKGRYVNFFGKERCYQSRDEAEALPPLPPRLKPTPEPPTEKRCIDCGRTLPIEAFPKHNKSRDGHGGRCKECMAKDMHTVAKRRAAEYERKRTTDDDGNALPEGMRRCASCGKVLPLAMFNKCSRGPGGLHHKCRDCQAAYARALYAKHKGEQPQQEQTKTEEPAKTQPTESTATLTDTEMVDLLRQHGWTVTCTRTEML